MTLPSPAREFVAPFNPYAPPLAELERSDADSADLDPASRGIRLGANLLDGLIAGLPTLALIWGVFTLLGYEFSFTEPTAQQPPELLSITLGFLIAASTYLAINGYLLNAHGQSVGKRLCGIRIVRQDGSPATLWDSFVKRHLSILALGQIPYAGGLITLIDPLFIFRESRLCLHDSIAGTMVVGRKAPAGRPVPSNPVPSSSSRDGSCPYCAERLAIGVKTCPDCKRDIHLVDSATAHQALTTDELLRKAYRLDARALHWEAMDVFLYITRRDPDCKDAWICLRGMTQAPQALQEEARTQVSRIQQASLRLEP